MRKTGENIKKICKQKGITVKYIQEELNVGAFQSIYNWFNGKTLPSLDNLYALSKILEVSMDNLVIGMSEIEKLETQEVARYGLLVDDKEQNEKERIRRLKYYIRMVA